MIYQGTFYDHFHRCAATFSWSTSSSLVLCRLSERVRPPVLPKTRSRRVPHALARKRHRLLGSRLNPNAEVTSYSGQPLPSPPPCTRSTPPPYSAQLPLSLLWPAGAELRGHRDALAFNCLCLCVSGVNLGGPGLGPTGRAPTGRKNLHGLWIWPDFGSSDTRMLFSRGILSS